MAARLEAGGWHCVLMDVDIGGLEHTETRTPVAVDLTDGQALARAADRIIAARPSIDMVIYNAGVSQICPGAAPAVIAAAAVADAASHRRVFEINYFAAVELARAFLHPIRASQGTHLAISSVAGFAPLYGRTAYAASKHAMQGFFGSLRSEEAAFGVRCLIAAPSFVATNLGNAGCGEDGIQRPGSATDGVDYMSAEAAASGCGAEATGVEGRAHRASTGMAQSQASPAPEVPAEEAPRAEEAPDLPLICLLGRAGRLAGVAGR